ncbi:pyridoxamine 5'-phosphate oxidase family protein [Alkalibacter saccharofermentans]|uniref:Nitroimidazol reductase NimA, pyridoxamine 5'-phosphate oxidase superfamily n=1 Tax=Alkalibacter saccharofermentans DSM 14828 TaxID=1120975 RepID=A0A1M4WE77_9FIRM|nr:pyridoxamine 5'-phosphate oxidase family protein [Alkalibacter saccharofermentans]SHE79485.1 hypothetical protein SAMN02746064_01209 [Alkalibacter saccharofermentans DSM 14828]
MFREMRKKERQMPLSECKKLLNESEYGFLAMTGEDGYPYSIALNYIYLDDKIYFHSALEGHKIDNLDYNDKVCFSIVGKTAVVENRFSRSYESIVVFGRAAQVDENEKTEIMIKLVEKYSPEKIDKGIGYIKEAKDKIKVYKIKIDHMSGKARK